METSRTYPKSYAGAVVSVLVGIIIILVTVAGPA